MQRVPFACDSALQVMDGKLGEMVRAGLPVPDAFVVLTGAYRASVAENELEADARRIAHDLPADDAALEETSRSLHRLFESVAMPYRVAEDLEAAYHAIGGRPVAVRSSATAEDLPGASFAGQHDSFLNVAGADAVAAAVKRCWSSLWNPRALAYRRRQGIASEGVAMAVVVQRMVTAERAGVLFTANPLDHRRDRMLLSASWGLGEAVVAGDVSSARRRTSSRPARTARSSWCSHARSPRCSRSRSDARIRPTV